MKKMKTFFFSFVPFLLGMGIQYIAVFYMMFLAAIFMLAVAPALIGSPISFDDFLDLMMDMNFNALVSIIFSVSCIVIFGIWYYKSCGGNYKFHVKKDFHPLQLVGILIMVPATQFATSLLIGILSSAFPKWLEEYNELMESAGLGTDTPIPLLMMVYSVCLAPFGEELIFRGVTMRIARRAFPFWIANILQAFLFGVFHMNMLQGCYAFALGLILGYVCERGGSIYYAILFHFLFNLWGTTASGWLEAMNPMILGSLVLLSAFVLLPVGILIYHLGIKKKQLANLNL